VLSSGRRIVLGLLLVGVGTAILADRIARMEGDHTFSALLGRWWPMAIIVAGCLGLLRFVRRPWQLIRPLAVVMIGALLLLVTTGIAGRHLSTTANQYYPLLWPAAMVMAGSWLAITAVEWAGGRHLTMQDGFHRSVCLQGDAVEADHDFTLGGVRVVLGYLRLDLSRLPWLGGPAALDVAAILGRVHVVVPDDLKVEQREAFVVGGRGVQFDRDPPRQGDEQLMIHVVRVFGSVVVEAPATTPTGADEPRSAS
jgi:hypothetical protein